MNRWLLWFSIIGVMVTAAWAWSEFGPPDPSKIYVFKGVRGPAGRSLMTDRQQAQISDYDNPDPHRLAVLVTDKTSGWLGLSRGFKARGIPFSMTADAKAALQHKVVLVYPIISGELGADALRGLAAHVREGGTVIGFNLAGGGLGELFGTSEGIESRATGRDLVTWTQAKGDPREDTISVSHSGESNVNSIGYKSAAADVIANYADGTAAITCRTVGPGRACLMGVDLGALAERAMNGRVEAIGRDYINGYEPSLDLLFEWVKDAYVAGEPMPWLISTAPLGKQMSIIMTHDIDFTRSVINMPAYAALERSHGIKATYFVQTKYVRDWNDDIFFNDQTVPILRKVQAQGMEMASHSVAHSRAFKAFPMGDGEEIYPKYRPFVIDQTHARNGTILGELRVPKFLLEKEVGQPVVSFRPGHLSFPQGLPQAMAATDYLYSSSLPAESTLGSVPYQSTSDRGDSVLEPVYEFPVTIEDEQPPELGKRFDQADAIMGRIAKRGGVATIMIHTDIKGHKLEFERRLIERWKGRAWMGALRDFGAWWAGRDALEVDVDRQDGRWVMTAIAGKPVNEVVVLFPKGQPSAVRLRMGGAQKTSFALSEAAAAN